MGSYFLVKFLVFIFGCFLFSLLINRLFLRFATNLGIRNIDENIVRWSSTSKPALGGISFYIIFLLSLSVTPLLFPKIPSEFNLQLIGIIAATSLGFLMGLADDAYNTNPSLKLLTQAVCAVVLIYTDTYIQLFEVDWLNYLLTILWVVGMMNSINMLDNMDAISTIASIAAFACMLLTMIIPGHFMDIYFIFIVGIIAALSGFLVYNWNPSKMYMGDTGSQFLGITLSAFSVLFLWNFQNPETDVVVSRQFLLPLLAFIVPISDTTSVVINRLSRGSSPFVGGKDHTTHHLSYLGLSDRQVALVIASISTVSAIMVIFALRVKVWNHLLTILFSAYAIGVFVSLFLITKRTSKTSK